MRRNRTAVATAAAGAGSTEKPVPPRPLVAVKGSRDGLRLVVSPGEAGAVEASLRDQLERRAATFFQGAEVELALPSSPLDVDLAARLAPLIAEAGMSLSRIVAVPATSAARGRSARREPSGDPAPAATVVAAGTLRGGQRLVHEGTMVVLGDVNPGAEISAGGSVVVWGRLRGKVEAGLTLHGSVVCALDLAPTQLRIGSAIARAPEDAGRTPVPEIAREENGRIVVEGWHP